MTRRKAWRAPVSHRTPKPGKAAAMGADDHSTLRQEALDAFARRAEDCTARLARALVDNPDDGALLLADAAARAEQGEEAPFARLEDALRRDPGWVAGHRGLAQLKTEFGEDAPLGALEHALALRPDDPRLWHCYLTLLSAQGRDAEAAARTAGLRRRIGDVPALRLLEARFAGLAGDPRRGEALLAGLPADLPELDYQRIRNALQRAALDEAMRLLDRSKLGADMRLWAMAELCWRASGDARHQWLIRGGSLFAGFDLGLSEAELAAAAGGLRALHRTRAAPPAQSLRGGTQTRGALHLRGDPALAPLFAAFAGALDAYRGRLAGLGPDHPLFALTHRSPAITASWSVRLSGGGFHVPHMHSEGLLSSACHLVVPEPCEAGEGALELGRPPRDIALDLEPLARFDPAPGRLVLFPSFLYHSTQPFARGERLTAVFDAA